MAQQAFSKHDRGILVAYEKGYRVTNDGRLLNPEGAPLKVNPTDKKRYPTFSIKLAGESFYIRSHRFAAYCFYKDELFKEGILVRHLNDDRSDISKENIKLGTQVENMADIPIDKLKLMSQKKRDWCLKNNKRPPLRRKLTDEQDAEIVRRLSAGESTRSIAKDFDVHHSTIQYLKVRKGLING